MIRENLTESCYKSEAKRIQMNYDLLTAWAGRLVTAFPAKKVLNQVYSFERQDIEPQKS